MTWLYLVFMYILPFTLLAIFNILIYMEIRKATKKRTRLTRLIFSSISICVILLFRSQRKEIGLAMMLFCVVAIFFICHILALVVNILEVLISTT